MPAPWREIRRRAAPGRCARRDRRPRGDLHACPFPPPPPLEHEHDVGVREARQAMRAEDDGDSLLRRCLGPERVPERGDDGRFGRDVDGREGIVEDEQRGSMRRRRQGPGQPEALPLAAGDPDARLPDLGVQALRERRHIVLDGGQPDRLTVNAVVSSKAGGVERDILPQRAREQRGVLGQIADEPTAFAGRQLGERLAVEEDRPRGDRIHAEDCPSERALSRPDRTGHGHERPGRNVEVQPAEHRRLGTGILKRQVPQRQRSRPEPRGPAGAVRRAIPATWPARNEAKRGSPATGSAGASRDRSRV